MDSYHFATTKDQGYADALGVSSRLRTKQRRTHADGGPNVLDLRPGMDIWAFK